ncbi:hypothetical protein N665_0741s0006 [Sinapis alba]|nr:hypothetical protein N665_0741s0006 [Sinapis alba]
MQDGSVEHIGILSKKNRFVDWWVEHDGLTCKSSFICYDYFIRDRCALVEFESVIPANSQMFCKNYYFLNTNFFKE